MKNASINLTVFEIENYYGNGAHSSMRKLFNLIAFGSDSKDKKVKYSMLCKSTNILFGTFNKLYLSTKNLVYMKNPKWHRDEIILALDLYYDKELGSIDSKNPIIIALSELLNQLPLFEYRPDKEKFRNPNGVSLKLSNFMAIDPNYSGKGMQAYSKLDKEIFGEFNNDIKHLHKVATAIKEIATNKEFIQELQKIEDNDSILPNNVKEGIIIYKLHKVRERNPQIIEAKKNHVLKEKNELRCEACGFNFEEFYGELGRGFIECHHIIPLSNFDTSKITRLEDLILLCSNCHRMTHRGLSINHIKERAKM